MQHTECAFNTSRSNRIATAGCEGENDVEPVVKVEDDNDERVDKYLQPLA